MPAPADASRPPPRCRASWIIATIIGVLALAGCTDLLPDMQARPVQEVRAEIGPDGQLTYERARELGFGEARYMTARFRVTGARACEELHRTFSDETREVSSIRCAGALPWTESTDAFERLRQELALGPASTAFQRGSTSARVASDPASSVRVVVTTRRKGLLDDGPDELSDLEIAWDPRSIDRARLAEVIECFFARVAP